ncbi:ATP synthase F1 subcomplex delta subunit [Parasphingorhabdus marina DSM 22363]|uniref:ATP synthase subunit delta n=1 Tax=Parasphingorhabdus marina DSM 22363 TaxID=1123272 RepID=A0A1N6GQ71_9SPHN|nr:F0F1 ATP synthase subunit delta [Parasphingorhabdus marina]SIO09701.1 ATP synthase F1 subcomplex delta subunit [Parasphingorhabdus marina DSM 22363]
MENSSGIRASLAGRYATALFELATENKAIDTVETSLASLKQAISESEDLSALTSSPVVSREDAGKAIAAAASSLGLDNLTTNVLGVLAANRRLDQIPALVRAFTTLASGHRGEVTAEVTSAHPLEDSQIDALKAQLKKRVGSDVSVSTQVDPDILGGLVVKIGSQMIDSSIKTRLNTLSQAMKG